MTKGNLVLLNVLGAVFFFFFLSGAAIFSHTFRQDFEERKEMSVIIFAVGERIIHVQKSISKNYTYFTQLCKIIFATTTKSTKAI